jgi:4-hydroxy-2-oxoheptanedioate aldolase
MGRIKHKDASQVHNVLVLFVSGKDVLEKMKRDELVLSMSLRVGMGNPSIEVASKLGFDYVYFDFEHGVLGIETFAELVREARLAGLTALCRAPGFDAAFVNRVLDAGAGGIVFPHAKTKQDAMRAVELTKYRTSDVPSGRRGFEPAYGFPKRDDESWNDYFKRVNEETLVGLMIEDKEGVDNIEEILSVRGIDFIYVGKMDMAFSYGVPFTPRAGRDNPVIEKAITRICAECKKRGIPVRFSVGVAPEDIVKNVKRWLPKGRSHLFMVNDMTLLMQGAEHYVDTLKKAYRSRK